MKASLTDKRQPINLRLFNWSVLALRIYALYFLCAQHIGEDGDYEHDGDDVIDEERSYKDEAKPGLTGSHFAIDAVPDHDDDRNHRNDPSHHSHRGLVQTIISNTSTMIRREPQGRKG